MTGGGVEGAGDCGGGPGASVVGEGWGCGGGLAAMGVGAAGLAGGDGARGADFGGLGVDRRIARVGAGDPPLFGAVRDTSRRRTAPPVALWAGVAWVLAGAMRGGCTARAALGAGVGRAAVTFGALGLCCRAIMVPIARPASSAIEATTAPIRG
jgi:hypothetical protein